MRGGSVPEESISTRCAVEGHRGLIAWLPMWSNREVGGAPVAATSDGAITPEMVSRPFSVKDEDE